MIPNSYEITLEMYVKQYVSNKSLATAKANGTYDKAIASRVLDFTYKTSPRKTWDIGKAEVTESLRDMVEYLDEIGGFIFKGNAVGYRNKHGELRVMLTDSFLVFDDAIAYLPDFADDVALGDDDSVVMIADFYDHGVITADGVLIPYDNHIRDTIVNYYGNGASKRKQSEAI